MTIDVEFCITYKSTVKYEIYKVKKIRTVEQFVIQRFILPFRGEEPNFQEQLQNFEVAASKFNSDCQSKGPRENLKKMSWDNPASPIDAKNSIGFFVPFFGWLAWTSM